MSRSHRFENGEPYLLTDMKEEVFNNEPAVFVGKYNSYMKSPTICAVCGQPLGSEGYSTFCLLRPKGQQYMMIGNGCIKDRIIEEHIDLEVGNHKDWWGKWNELVRKFPDAGRWYGTFLHHSIAKPYVRDKNVAETWDNTLLDLPAVRFIMEVIDDLRDEGWSLDAEKVLDCGRIDLLATHPDRGAIVFDWKSDRCYDSVEQYKAQINKYMTELHNMGEQKITGYIIWIREEKKEPVLFDLSAGSFGGSRIAPYMPREHFKCTLSIDWGDEHIVHRKRKKKLTEYSQYTLYGEEVAFFLPPLPWTTDERYTLKYLEASPFEEGGRPQLFNLADLENNIPIRFLCSKKRHLFNITAYWELKHSFVCRLGCISEDQHHSLPITLKCMSQTDADGNHYAEFEVSEINQRLKDRTITYAALNINASSFGENKAVWTSDELQDGMKIHIPCIDNECSWLMKIRTVSNTEPKLDPGKDGATITSDYTDASPFKFDWAWTYSPDEQFQITLDPVCHFEDAEFAFTEGCIYKSGNRYFGIYRRKAAEEYDVYDRVNVAEVDVQGRKISDLVWRRIYTTKSGKEYIYGITNHKWKVYTSNVLAELSPEGMERFG